MSYINHSMGYKCLISSLVLVILMVVTSSLHSIEFYEKSEIQARMEKREVISVVKVVAHPKKRNMEVLKMNAAGILERVSVPRAMELMSDYNNLQKIAPDYIKLSELIVKKTKNGEYRKYLHMKTEVTTLVANYSIEIFARVHEEETEDKGVVHWQIVPASEVGRKATTAENFVGLKGDVSIKKYKRAAASVSAQVRKQGFYRSRPNKNQLMVLFRGELEREDMSKLIPNFLLQFAMEVALQRVGILLRNYMETAKDIPTPKDLEALYREEMKRYPAHHDHL